MPLNGNSKEEKCSISKIVLSHDTTYIGRDITPVADKRLSRRHIAVTISADGSADILVVRFSLSLFVNILKKIDASTAGT